MLRLGKTLVAICLLCSTAWARNIPGDPKSLDSRKAGMRVVGKEARLRGLTGTRPIKIEETSLLQELIACDIMASAAG